MTEKKRVIVIGGGPGGYVAAIRAAQLGAQVTLIEKGEVGGTCLNVGCIPTKVLLHSGELFAELQKPEKLGLKIQGLEVKWDSLQQRKNAVVKRLVSGVKHLLKAKGIKLVKGTASFTTRSQVMVTLANGEVETITGDAFIIATGSVPFLPPIEGINSAGVVTSTEALSFTKIPESMVIIGGGVIGVEFASLYSSLGCSVTIVEMMPQILPNLEEELVDILKKKLERNGIKIYNNSQVTSLAENGGKVKVAIKNQEKDLLIEGEKVLVAVGRKIVTEGLGLNKISLQLEGNKIVVNNKMETNVPNIYAIGDCTGENMLAHVASHQGIIAAENIMGKDVKMDYKTVPACIYTHPEMASVGLTEKEAQKQGYSVKVGRFPLAANGKSLIMNATEGMVKIIAEEKYNEILGIHILGPRATDLIVQGALALRLEATLEEIITTIHPHPTVGEAIMEAAFAAQGMAIHIPK